MNNVLRALTVDEKKEITPLGSTSLLDLFLKHLAKKVTEYQKKLRPYDSYAAHIDFDLRVKIKMTEMQAAVDKTNVNNFDFGDLDRYGKKELFEFIEKVPSQQTRLVAGIKQEIITGQVYKFKCKERGNKISILVSNEKVDEFDKWLDVTYINVPKAKDEADADKLPSKSTTKTKVK